MNRNDEFLRNMAREFEAGFKKPRANKGGAERVLPTSDGTAGFRGPKVRTDDTLIRGDHAFIRGTIVLNRTVPDSKGTIEGNFVTWK